MRRPQTPDADAVGRFARTLGAVQSELDWQALGHGYCETGGEHFFSPEAVEAIQDTGLLFASDLADLLTPGGRSLYLGIGVAELVPMLFECLVLGRTVDAFTLPSDEARALQDALEVARRKEPWQGLKLQTKPCPQATEARADHLWFASVLTDPDAFPALHDRLYGRQGTPEATGRGNFPRERQRAFALIEKVWSWLRVPALVTTSQEELPLIQEALGASAGRLLIPAKARLSAIVGDPLFHCNWGP